MWTIWHPLSFFQSDRWRRLSATVGLGVILGLGTLYVVLAAGLAFIHLTAGEPWVTIWFETTLLAGIGASLLYGGYWLGRTGIAPPDYIVIAERCLAGSGVMLGLLIAYYLNPATGISSPEWIVPLLTALSSAAGFGVGIHKARARELRRTKEQLDDVVADLQTANERLDQFAGVISHDLKQPLRTVTSYLELLDRRYGDEIDDGGQELLDEALDGAVRMRAMIDGLLEYAQHGEQTVSFEPVDCEAVVEEVLSNLEATIEESDADVTVESLPEVYGERTHIRLLFQNLLENAIKYTGETPPRIHVASEYTSDEWQISIADNGIGIDSDATDRVFELFQRSHGLERYDGIGLGLALCKQIVDRHGGDIWVESELGEGSTFYVTFPSSR